MKNETAYFNFTSHQQSRLTQRKILIASFLGTLFFHLLANPHYGISRDELYFIICGQSPDWGYVDQPPLAPLLAAGSQIFGASLFNLRAIPALLSALSVVFTQLIAIEFGSGLYGLALSGLIAFFCPILMMIGLKVSCETMNLFLWPLIIYLTLRMTKQNRPSLWIYIGLATGISFHSKHSVLFFILALLVGLLFSKHRRFLFSKWAIMGGGLAFLIALPHAIWQISHEFPMIELLKNAEKGKNVVLSPIEFIFSQVLITHPAYFIILMFGLFGLMKRSSSRFLAITYLVFILEMILLKGKHYYAANIYPLLIAAGSVAMEEKIHVNSKIKPWLLSIIILLGLVFVPYSVPILPVESFISYHTAMGPWLHMGSAKTETDMIEPGKLDWPEWADMQGWPHLAKTVADVYSHLSPEDRSKAVILTRNYGQASAIKFYNSKEQIPQVISGHNQYFLWGPQGASGEVLIDVGGDCLSSLGLYQSSEVAQVFLEPHMRSTESTLPIRVCRGIKKPFIEVWDSLKLYL